MSQSPLEAVFAEPQQLLTRAQHFPGKVVQSIQLVRSRRQQSKSSRSQPASKSTQVGNPKLDFDFPLHCMKVYYGATVPVAGEESAPARDPRIFFSHSTGSIRPTTNTQASAPIQENTPAMRKGQ